MDELLKNWPLVVVPTILYCLSTFVGSRRLDKTYQSLGGRISSRDDLMIMKKAINLDMTLALVLMSFVLVYIGGMLYLAFTRSVGFLTAAIYIPVLTSAGFFCSLLYTRKVENRAKNMTVTAEEPGILETYRRWVQQWSEARLRLPD